VWDTNGYQWTPDTYAVISLTSDMALTFTATSTVMLANTSSATVFYKLTSLANRGQDRFKVAYTDLRWGSYTNEMTVNILPLENGTGLSDLSVDAGEIGGLSQVVITPNGDGINDVAFINFKVGDPTISWRIQISSDEFVSIFREEWGNGTPARRSWDALGVAPGTYKIKVIAGGTQDTSLSVIVQAVELKGRVLNSTTSLVVPEASINLFGAINRNTKTDSEGRFSLIGVPQGNYTLRIEKPGYIPYEAGVSMTGTTQDLGNIAFVPFSKLVFQATRIDSPLEVWGRIKAVGGGEEFSCSVHFGVGKTSPDNGFSVNLPELFLKPGISYAITTEFLDYPSQSLTRTFAVGEKYNWILTLNPKGAISGTLRLGNGIPNPTGIAISLSAGLDANSDGIFDSGAPSLFAQANMPAFESQVGYSFRGANDGKYLITIYASGFSPLKGWAVISGGAGVLADFTLIQSGNLDINLLFTGDSTFLNSGYAVFPVTLRIQTDGGYSAALTSGVVKNAVSSTGLFRFTGVPNGNVTIYADKIDGFALTPPGPKSAMVALATGTANLNFVRYSGSIVGTVILPGGSSINDLRFMLTNGVVSAATPTVLSNPFEYRNLDSGWYRLSVLDTLSGAHQIQQVFVTNGFASSVTFNLAGLTTYSVAGTVRTVAAPPYDSLASIVALSSPTLINDEFGNPQPIPGLRIEAYMLNPDNTTDPLPMAAGTLLDPAKIKFGLVDSTSGTYFISGFKQGTPYKIRIYPDINGDETPDIPIDERLITLFSNQTGVDFTIRSGGSITGTITAPASDNGHALTVSLTDVDSNQTRTLAISLVGSDASFTFNNLRVGRYLVQVFDQTSPAVYAAKPVLVNLDTVSGSKSVAISLSMGAVIRGKLADSAGLIVTPQNLYKLPAGFVIKLVSPNHTKEAVGPSADGTFFAEVFPNVDYGIFISPPSNQSVGDLEGKIFVPVTLQGRAGVGEVFDWGTVVLNPGTRVTGTVEDSQGAGKTHIVVLAYQTLARNLEPIKVFTNEQGQFTFDGLDPRVRFYDFVGNKKGHADALPNWSEGIKNMIDITQPSQIQTLNLQIAVLAGGIKGVVVSSTSLALKAGFGLKTGWPGVSILLTKRGERRVLEYISEANGSFNIPLENGGYDIELIAQNHKTHMAAVTINGAEVDLGTISLGEGVGLSGTLRNADGTLPTQIQVAQVLAIDAQKKIYRAYLTVESITQSVDRYTFNGLTPGVHTLLAVDQLGRPRVLREQFNVPAQATVLDLTFSVSEPKLVASFIQKLPDGVEAIFGCNQAFRNLPDDLDSDSVADDNEFENFVTVTQGNGALAFTSVDAERHKASYLYTMGNETGNSALKLSATFRTEEMNPASGQHFIVTGSFVHPFGLASAQENLVTSLGGEFSLPGGSGLSLPENWLVSSGLEGVTVKFQAAAGLGDFAGQSEAGGMNAKALALKLGPAYYPSHMFKAIRALDSVPDVNPFSSFYDIFLPASVSRVFSNKPTLTLTYDETVEDPDTLNIYYFNEAQGVYTIENTDRRIDRVNRTISVSIGHASVFTVLASSASIIRGGSHSGTVEVFNFPNPFDLTLKTITLQHPGSNSASQQIQGTMIKVSVPDDVTGSLEIQIFNLAGEKIRTLSGSASVGGSHYYVEWDGTNEHGKDVASGIYIGRLTISGSNEKFFKMAVVK